MVRCDMCENLATRKFYDGKTNLDVCRQCYTVLQLNADVQKLNQYWVDKYNELHKQINDIAEAQRIKIEILSKQLKNLTWKVDYVYNSKEIC